MKTKSNYSWQVAHFMRRIGHIVRMDYDCRSNGGSGANTYNVTSYFPKEFRFSYNYTSRFNEQMLINEINASKPIYVAGFRTRIKHRFIFWIYYTYEGGHAWVVDGYKRVQHQTTAVTYTYHSNNPPNYDPNLKCQDVYSSYNNGTTCSYYSYSYDDYLFHCNWGWKGEDNNYVGSNFKANNAQEYKYKRRIMTLKPR